MAAGRSPARCPSARCPRRSAPSSALRALRRGSVRSGRCGGVGQRGSGATPWSSAKPRGPARPRGECRAGSDWRRVREIVKEVGHLLGLHRRRATRLNDLHRVKQLDELIPALGQGSRSAGRDLGFLTFSSKGGSRGVAGRDSERGGPRHPSLSVRQPTAHPAGLRSPAGRRPALFRIDPGSGA